MGTKGKKGKSLYLDYCFLGYTTQTFTFRNGMIVSHHDDYRCVQVRPYKNKFKNEDGSLDIMSYDGIERGWSPFLKMTDRKHYVLMLTDCEFNGFGMIESNDSE